MLVYLNIFIAVVLAVVIIYGEASLLEDGVRPQVLFVLFILQVVDLVLNIIEDVFVACAKKHPLAIFMSEIPLPGLGSFSCICLSPASQFEGGQNPLLPS